MKIILALLSIALISGCSSLQKKSMMLDPGMSKAEVVSILGLPENRSFRGNSEALQYSEVAGFGQCNYMIAWFTNKKLLGITNRRGGSVAGCGLGSREVDWGQIPKPSLDLNITTKHKS